MVRAGDEIAVEWGDASATLYPLRRLGYRAYVMEFVHLGGPRQDGDALEALRETDIPAWVIRLADTPELSDRTTGNEALPLADRYEAFGWPAASLTSASYGEFVELTNWSPQTSPKEGIHYVVRYHGVWGISTGEKQKELGREWLVVLPFRPRAGSFAVNTLFYGVILWLLWSAPFATRRLVRKRRGRCVRCGYDLTVLIAVPGLWISVERTRSPETGSPAWARPEEVAFWERVVDALRIPLATADLRDAQLSLKPADWLDRDIARLDFLEQYRGRRGIHAGKELEGEEKEAFEDEWQRRREEYLSHIDAPLLKGADLRGANMAGAFLVGADLSDANLQGANLWRSYLEGADLEAAYLEGARLSQAHLRGADLDSAHLEGVDLEAAYLERAHLRKARLEGARLSQAHLNRAHLGGAHLEGAILIGARLEGAILIGAHLEGTYLRKARLDGANLLDAHLLGVVLWGADLRDARNLTQEQLDGAIGDKQTRLPEGLTIPSCWTEFP